MAKDMENTKKLTWQEAISQLGRHFGVKPKVYNQIIKDVQNLYGNAQMAAYYNGNREEYLYDKAISSLHSVIGWK